MKKIKVFFIVSGILMSAYLLFALFTFVFSAMAYILAGAPFSESGHAMFLDILKLPAIILIPSGINCVYAMFQLYRFFKNERNVEKINNFFEDIFSN